MKTIAMFYQFKSVIEFFIGADIAMPPTLFAYFHWWNVLIDEMFRFIKIGRPFWKRRFFSNLVNGITSLFYWNRFIFSGLTKILPLEKCLWQDMVECGMLRKRREFDTIEVTFRAAVFPNGWNFIWIIYGHGFLTNVDENRQFQKIWNHIVSSNNLETLKHP